MQSKSDRILLWILRGGLCLILFSVFIFTPDFFFPYITGRAIYFQILTEILLIPAVLLIVLYPSYRPKSSLISRALIAFFAVAVISTINSADTSKSFIGMAERAGGLFNIIHFGILFFVAVTAFRTQRQWNVLLGTSVAISAYASVDFILPMLSKTGGVPPSVAGNPMFIAAYILFHIFFASFLITQTKNKLLRALLGVIIVIQTWAVLATNVRGAFVGLVAGVFVMLFLWAWRHIKMRGLLIGFVILMIAGYALLFINRNQPAVRSSSILQRVTSFSFEDATTQARFSMWRMAIAGFKERPLLGWGRENFSLVFNTHFDSSFDKAKVGEAWEDRAHNVFFDELVNGGIVGLAVYVFLLTAVFIAVRKKPLFIAMLVAYTVQNLFGIDTLNSYLPFFLWLALIDFKPLPQTQRDRGSVRLIGAICISSTIFIVAAALFLNVRLARGNMSFSNAIKSLSDDNYSEFLYFYDKGKTLLKPFPAVETEILANSANSVIQAVRDFPLEKAMPVSVYLKQYNTDLWQLYPRNQAEQKVQAILASSLMLQAFIDNDRTPLDKAKNIILQLIKSSPNRMLFADLFKRYKITENAIEQKMQTSVK